MPSLCLGIHIPVRFNLIRRSETQRSELLDDSLEADLFELSFFLKSLLSDVILLSYAIPCWLLFAQIQLTRKVG